MELIEFIVFLSINILLLVITLTRKAAIYGIIGMLIDLFILADVLVNPLVLDTIYVVNQTGIVEVVPVYAGATWTVLTITLITLFHALTIIKVTGKE